MGTPFKMKSGNKTSFKDMGSSPVLKTDIYESYIDEDGNKITKNLGTGSTAEQKANEVNRKNQVENSNKLKALKLEMEKKKGGKIDTSTEEGEGELTRDMNDAQFEKFINLRHNKGGGSRTLTYTGSDAENIRKMNATNRAAFNKGDFSKSEISGEGGIDINTADMNKDVQKSAKIIKNKNKKG